MRKTAILLILCGMATANATALANSGNSENMVGATATCTDDKPPEFTDTQREAMYTVRTKYEDSGALRGVELSKLHRQFHHELDAENINKATLTSLQSKINELEAAKANDRLNMMLEMHNILTADQKQFMRKHRPPHSPFGPGAPGMPPFAHQPAGHGMKGPDPFMSGGGEFGPEGMMPPP